MILNYTYDIGGLSTKKIVFNDKQEIISETFLEYKNIKRIGPGSQINATEVFEIIRNDIPKDKSINLGLSIPGLIDSKNNKILSDSSLKFTSEVNLDEIFKIFKNIKKIVIENDAKAAAIGEYVFGQKRSCSNMLHVTIGTGLGAGIIINGQLYKGNKFGAGEISKIFSNFENDKINFLVQFGSTNAALMRYSNSENMEKPVEIKPISLNSTESVKMNIIDGKEFMEQVEKQNKISEIILNDWINNLSKFLISINFFMDFDLITIGGGISSNKRFMKELQTKLNQYTQLFQQFLNFEGVNVLKSKLENKAGCYGMLIKLLDSN
ncbi:ROK family protein [Mesoplasma tabanidae]|uniref:Glucokinase n=1 Tax=Mesoplasma tabanidae TaxID=219745 RepID=A0A2K8P7F4_9MOLU|nr:ROK family protein [Mesoplasma tabanidae]ATZ21673.1 hypothetical protein MTABA_v1c04750 [Mesoplasma tabanidae]